MERHDTPESVARCAISALWYAWGQIDGREDLKAEGYNTDQGWEFSRLYERMALDYADGKRNSRGSVLDCWREYLRCKQERGIDAGLTVDDIDNYVRISREIKEARS